MRLKKSLAVCAILLAFASAADASFLSDWIESVVVGVAENAEIENSPDSTLSADEALAHSIELLSDGRQAEAEDLIKSAVKTHRDDIRILFAKGVLERSRWSKGAAQVWFALARKAKGNEALSRAAWLSMQLDQKRSVEENLAELIRLSDENPDDIYLLWLGAIQCRERSKQEQVIEITKLGSERYRMLLSKFSLGPVLLHHTYANTLDDLGEYEKSLEHRILAVSMEAKGWSLDGLAFTLYKSGKHEWSSAVYARVLRRNKNDETYWARWGNTLSAMGHYEEAEEKYRRALRLAPKEGWIWDNLARCLGKLGKDKERFDAYQQAADLGYNNAVGSLGWCYNFGYGVRKDKRKALQFYSKYNKKDPNSPWGNLNLGNLYTASDCVETNFAKGIQCYEKALKRYPTLYSRLGWCYSQGTDDVKDPEKALYHFEKALDLYPTNTVLLCNFTYFLSTTEDPEFQDYPRAAKLADQLLNLAEAEEFCGTAAQAYFKNRQYEKAVGTQLRKVELYQKNHPADSVPEAMGKKLDEYKTALEESKEES